MQRLNAEWTPRTTGLFLLLLLVAFAADQFEDYAPSTNDRVVIATPRGGGGGWSASDAVLLQQNWSRANANGSASVWPSPYGEPSTSTRDDSAPPAGFGRSRAMGAVRGAASSGSDSLAASGFGTLP